MFSEYAKKKVHMIAILFLVIGGLNLGFMALTGKDVMSMLMGQKTILTNAMFIVIGLSALAIAFYRDSYLPFLGETVMPCSLLTPSTPEGADSEVRVRVQPGQKVLYWAAEPATKDLEDIVDWRKAYLGLRNAGVVLADADGYAVLTFRSPQPYTVPSGTLAPHVHYRVCLADGMVSRVETVTLEKEPEMPEEGFRAAMPPDEDAEGFRNMYKSQQEMVPATPFSIVDPSTAQDEINAVVHETARRSLMTEISALDESPNKYVDMLASAEFA
jgi:uncharacterized membrane protein YuzA (DUF378 family)